MSSPVSSGAHSDGQNQVMSVIGVIGTLGTADIGGTALTLPIGVAPLTGAMYVHDLSGAGGTTNIQGTVAISGGTMQLSGTPNVTLIGGTLNAGTVTVGSISAIGQVHNAGTLAGGTLGQLTNGSIVVTAGTVTVGNIGTLGTLQSGTVSVNTPGTITSGSIAVTAGTVIVTSGTVNSGTINSGTINAGTFRDDGRPARNLLSFATTITFGGSAFATLVGSAVVGAGTSLWVNDVSIVNNGGTQKYGVVFGSAINGSAVVAKGQFGPQGGIQKSFPMPVNAGMTNFDLNAWAEGAGTADFVVSYFISA